MNCCSWNSLCQFKFCFRLTIVITAGNNQNEDLNKFKLATILALVNLHIFYKLKKVPSG